MYQTLKKLYYSKLLCRKLFLIARMKTITAITINIKIINFSIINLIEIINLTKFVILINLKRIINQIIILKRKRASSARILK